MIKKKPKTFKTFLSFFVFSAHHSAPEFELTFCAGCSLVLSATLAVASVFALHSTPTHGKFLSFPFLLSSSTPGGLTPSIPQCLGEMGQGSLASQLYAQKMPLGSEILFCFFISYLPTPKWLLKNSVCLKTQMSPFLPLIPHGEDRKHQV